MRVLRTCVIALFSAAAVMSGQAPTIVMTPSPSAAVKADAQKLHDALPPSAALEEILTPFDALRADMNNWSDAELGGLAIAVRTAKSECIRLTQTAHEGEELYALARMCSTGQQWAFANSAGSRYVRDVKAPHVAQAYYIIVQAQLNMGNVAGAVEYLQEMKRVLPLNAETDAVFNYALRVLEVPQPDAGVKIAKLRQPHLLEMLKDSAGTFPAGVAEAEAIHTLELLYFSDSAHEELKKAGDAFNAALQQRTGTLDAAQKHAAALAHRRYDLLGARMPEIVVKSDSYGVPLDQAEKVLRLYVIIPENCVTCASMSVGMDTLRSKLNVNAQAWLVSDASGLNARPPKAIGISVIGERPTDPPAHQIVSTTALLQQIGASGSPLFVVTDEDNDVQFISTGQPGWLPQDGTQESIAEVIMDRVANARHAVAPDPVPPAKADPKEGGGR